MDAHKKKRALWSEKQLQDALGAIGGGMSVRTASETFKIPRRTLRNHVSSGKNTKQLGRASYLSPLQEKELCTRIFRLADVGMPVTGNVIRRSVYTFCEQNKIETPFNHFKGIAGRKWLSLFLKRHPDVGKRKTQSMNPGRAAKLNKFIVNDYYNKLKEVMTRLDIFDKPQLIFNMDEKGCRLSLHKQQSVYAKKGSKRVHMVAPEHGENVSIVSCGNALGQVIPPMILFKGKRLQPEWQDNLPPGSAIEMTEKGSMTTSTFIKWVHHFAKFKPQGNILLIFDGAKSHLDAGIVDTADTYGITLFCFPSNTTHELQPMDKSVFGPFEEFWDQEVLLYWTTTKTSDERTVSKRTFGKIFSKVWPRAATPSNVSAGFRATGIYPFDPNVIPEQAFAPSELTRRDNENAEEIPSQSKPDDSDQPIMRQQPAKDKSLIKKKGDKRMTYSSDSSSTSVSDTISLHDESRNDGDVLETSFQEILQTPDVKKKTFKQRAKALNYTAVQVTKALFTDKQDKKPVKGENKQTKQKKGGAKTSKDFNVKKGRGKTQSSLKDLLEAGPSGLQHSKTGQEQESWFCYLCSEDRIADMRLCMKCLKYVHEECVGLTREDNISKFLCPECDV